MTMLLTNGIPAFAAVFKVRARGKAFAPAGQVLYPQLLPTDPLGDAVVTFDGANAGSEIRVFSAAGVELAGIESCAAGQVLSWPAYSVGSPGNTVMVRIVNTAYKIKEFSYTTLLGAQVIPVQQEPDKWYSNP